MATKKYEIGATSRRRDGMYKKVAADKWEKVSETGGSPVARLEARKALKSQAPYNRREIGGWGAKTMPVGERPAAKSPVARAEARKAIKPDPEDTHEAHTKAAESHKATAAALRKAGKEAEAKQYDARASEHAEKAYNRREIGGWGAKTMPVGAEAPKRSEPAAAAARSVVSSSAKQPQKVPPGFADKKSIAHLRAKPNAEEARAIRAEARDAIDALNATERSASFSSENARARERADKAVRALEASATSDQDRAMVKKWLSGLRNKTFRTPDLRRALDD